jgi:hypothetical protein
MERTKRKKASSRPSKTREKKETIDKVRRREGENLEHLVQDFLVNDGRRRHLVQSTADAAPQVSQHHLAEATTWRCVAKRKKKFIAKKKANGKETLAASRDCLSRLVSTEIPRAQSTQYAIPLFLPLSSFLFLSFCAPWI